MTVKRCVVMSITLCDFCLILQKKSDAKWWEFLIKQSKQNTFTIFWIYSISLDLCNINLFRKSKVAKNVAQVCASSSLSTLFNFLFDYNFNLSLNIESFFSFFFFFCIDRKAGTEKLDQLILFVWLVEFIVFPILISFINSFIITNFPFF